MNLGAEPKKVAILGALALVGAYSFYTNVLSGPASGPQAAATPARSNVLDSPAAPPPVAPRPAESARRREAGRNSQEFRPSLKRRPEDQVDPLSIDPTLRLDLLAKVNAVAPEGGERNLFQFSAPPPPPVKLTEPKIIPKMLSQIEAEREQQRVAVTAESGPPPPPPINLKYYGFSTSRGDGSKRAFFLDGEDILVAAEGETVKRRYRVVRIGVNSVVMEDQESKSQQTLPLTEEALG